MDSSNRTLGQVYRLGENELPDWDRFVARHKSGTVYLLSIWKQFLEDVYPHIRGEVLALRDTDSGEITAGIPIYTATSKLLGKRLVSIPFATLGGALVSSSEGIACLWPAILERIKSTRARRLEVRGIRNADQMGVAPLMASAEYLHHYIELPHSPGELHARFSKGVRYSIAKARKAGVEVQEDTNPKRLRDFSSMHQLTRRRLGLPAYPSHFYEAMVNHLSRSVVSLLVAVHEGEMLGGLLSLDFGDCVIYEYVADNNRGRALGANQLLLWTCIERAVLSGRRLFSLGRTTTDNAGLIQYKRSWGATQETLSTLVYPPFDAGHKESLSGLSASPIVRFVFRSLPAPLARIVGALFYRHWA